MKIYIDEEFNVCEGRSLRVSRGDLLALEVVLPASAGEWLEVRFGGKLSHDGEFLVYSYATGVSGEFTLSLNLNTEALQSALGDEACLVIPCELEFRRDGEVQTVRGIKLRVDQDIIKGGEVAPSEVPGVLDISDDGYFIISGVKTAFVAEPKITIEGKNLFINGVDSGQRCVAPVITIGDNGNWFEDGVDTGRRAIAQESGIPLFFFVYSDHAIEDENWVVSDGQWLDGNTYSDAYALLLSQYSAGTTKMADNISYREASNKMRIAALNQSTLIDSQYTSRGDAWFYVLDSLNKRFKLPRTKNFLRPGEAGGVGAYEQDQIVNITGDLSSNGYMYSTTGNPTNRKFGAIKVNWAEPGHGFYRTGVATDYQVSNSFNASQQVHTGDQVQPRSTSVLLCFRVANRYA